MTSLIPANLLPSRFLRNKRPATSPTSPSQSSGRPTPLIRLVPRDEQSPRELIRTESGKRGMTVLSFLLNEARQSSNQARSDNSGDRPSVELARPDLSGSRHIIPPAELAKITLKRSFSASSLNVEAGPIAWLPSSPLTSPSLRTLPKPDQDLALTSILPTPLSPPPRRRGAPSTLMTPPPSAGRTITFATRRITLDDLPDTPSTLSHAGHDDGLNSSPRTQGSGWSSEREREKKRLEEWLASKPTRTKGRTSRN